MRDLYKKMYDFVADNDGKFQVIAVDHADFNEEWFTSSVVKDWRDQSNGPVGLVPATWIERIEATTDDGSAAAN